MVKSDSGRTRRRTVALLAASMVLGACNVASTVADGIKDVATDAADAVSEAVNDGASGGAEPAGPGQPDSAPGGGGEAPAPGGLGAPVDDFSSVGFNGPAMLRGAVQRLVLEIDVQEGVQVSQSAVDHLVATMRQVADKPGGIVLAGGNTFASGETRWTPALMREVAKANRSNYSDSGTVVVYLLYLDGGFVADGQETSAIGVAHNASEIGVFPGRWEGMSLLGSSSNIERAVVVHEWGHLLGLVNIGYTSEIDHEDSGHPGHSSNKGSVMFHAVDSTLIGQVFSGPPPASFDDADLADLEGLRSGKYRS